MQKIESSSLTRLHNYTTDPILYLLLKLYYIGYVGQGTGGVGWGVWHGVRVYVLRGDGKWGDLYVIC